MKKVYTARDSMEAHFIRCLLEREGIEAVVFGEPLGLARGELPYTPETLPSVWVRSEDAEQALDVVEDYDMSDDMDGDDGESEPLDPWICPNCGEEIEGHFTDCWKCQTPRPGDLDDED